MYKSICLIYRLIVFNGSMGDKVINEIIMINVLYVNVYKGVIS